MNDIHRHVVTLVYVRDEQDRYLLIRRNQSPNRGLYSPPGGKVERDESPRECAIRELEEETGLRAIPERTRLAGMVTEISWERPGDQWIMFLYLVEGWTGSLRNSPEGEAEFIANEEIENLPIPDTDREILWKQIRRNRFFEARIRCLPNGEFQTLMHESE